MDMTVYPTSSTALHCNGLDYIYIFTYTDVAGSDILKSSDISTVSAPESFRTLLNAKDAHRNESFQGSVTMYILLSY